MAKPKDSKSPSKLAGFLTPGQQWLALSLLGILCVIAVFYFGIGGLNSGGHGGF